MKMKYRIMKLRSGETVISKITSSTKETITLERPMEMHFPQFIDPTGEMHKGTPFFKNWLAGTNSNDITIPKNHIAAYLPPSREVVFLYEDEKKREDTPTHTFLPPEEDESAETELSKLFGSLFGPKGLQRQTENSEEESPENNNPQQDPNTVSVNIKIPPQLFLHILASGILANEEIPLDDIDFDDDFEDWSDDPKDYK